MFTESWINPESISCLSVSIGNTDYINVKNEGLSRRLTKRTDVRGPVAKHPAVPEMPKTQ